MCFPRASCTSPDLMSALVHAPVPRGRARDRVAGWRKAMPPEWLVKWRSLPYAAATWETCRTMVGHQGAINRFRSLQQPPPPKQLEIAAAADYRPPISNFHPLSESPIYKGGRTLRPHQIEGAQLVALLVVPATLRHARRPSRSISSCPPCASRLSRQLLPLLSIRSAVRS